MRFIDASARGVDATPQQPLANLIQELTKSFVDLREETKLDARNSQQRQEGIFKALCQRHETDMTNVLQYNAKLVTESRAIMEKHMQEALRMESASFEERNKMHAADVKAQLDHFQTTMEVDATYRDTLYTDHQLATEKRLQDSEARASDRQDKHRQEVKEVQEEQLGMVKDQIAKSDKTEARVEDLVGKVTHIEATMKENIVQTILELIQQRRAFRLENGTVIQLMDAPPHEPTVEVDVPAMEVDATEEVMTPDWCEEDEVEAEVMVDPEGLEPDGAGADEAEFVDKSDQEAVAARGRDPPTLEERSPLPRRRREDRKDRRDDHRLDTRNYRHDRSRSIKRSRYYPDAYQADFGLAFELVNRLELPRIDVGCWKQNIIWKSSRNDSIALPIKYGVDL